MKVTVSQWKFINRYAYTEYSALKIFSGY